MSAPTKSIRSLVAATALAALAFAACEEGSHLLTGRFYVEARDCLGTTSSIDVVSGDDPGACAPACLVQRSYDGGRPVYVTTTCPPYPVDVDSAGTDARCPAALAALARNDTCLSDGGSTAPLPRDGRSRLTRPERGVGRD